MAIFPVGSSSYQEQFPFQLMAIKKRNILTNSIMLLTLFVKVGQSGLKPGPVFYKKKAK
jgi:hypothetical protein